MQVPPLAEKPFVQVRSHFVGPVQEETTVYAVGAVKPLSAPGHIAVLGGIEPEQVYVTALQLCDVGAPHTPSLHGAVIEPVVGATVSVAVPEAP